jgi:DNA-binding protein HU-beta
MWIRIRAVIFEDEPLACQYLAELLDETCQVEVVGTATESEAGLRLCAELRPDAVFVDINLPGKDGVSLANSIALTVLQFYKTIKKSGEFVLPGFGKLVKQKRKARTGFNPKTQQKIKIPAKTVVKFRVAKAAKDAVLGVKK